jgi:hypothetical protein
MKHSSELKLACIPKSVYFNRKGQNNETGALNSGDSKK